VVYFIGETEEYEPLSRAAYYHFDAKDAEKNKNPFPHPPRKERIGE
jgi:hypothetical protein